MRSSSSTEAISLRPDWAALYRGRAKLLQERPDATAAHRQAAQADLRLAIHHERTDKRVLALDHTNLGKLLYFDGQFNDALKESELALQFAPDYVEASVLRIPGAAQVEKVRRGDPRVRHRAGKRTKVCRDLRVPRPGPNRCRELPGSDPRLRPGPRVWNPAIPRSSRSRGWAYLSCDAAKLALVDFDAALKIAPEDADAYTGRGSAHVQQGDHRAAVADAREAIHKGKSDPRVMYNAARIYAIATSVAASEVTEKGRAAVLLASQYQDAAVHLIRARFEREAPETRPAFWNTIQGDPALKSIKRRLNYDELVAANKKAGN